MLPALVSLLLILDKGYEAAEGGFTAVKLPGKAANPDALVEYFIDHATGVLYMEDTMGEHIIVHELQVVVGPDLFKWFAQFLRALCRKVRAHFADDGIHGMIH